MIPGKFGNGLLDSLLYGIITSSLAARMDTGMDYKNYKDLLERYRELDEKDFESKTTKEELIQGLIDISR